MVSRVRASFWTTGRGLRAGVSLAGSLLMCGACQRAESSGLFKSEVPIPEKDGATLPSWLVEARIRQDGRTLGSVVTIVDTGAQATVIDRAWAAEHGLLTRAGSVVAVDIAGSSIDTTLASDVQLSFGAVDARAVEVVVIDMPEILRRIGVVAIWSPQSTVPPGRLFRLDLWRGSLELDDATALSEPRLASCVGDLFESAALIVEAVVGGHAVRLELDSGSSDTSVIMSSAAGSALSELGVSQDKTSYGAAGSFSVLELLLTAEEAIAAARTCPRADLV